VSAHQRLSAAAAHLRPLPRAAKIALVYAALGLFCVWTSAWVFQWFGSESGVHVSWEEIEATAFVLLTGAVLYILLARTFHRLGESQASLLAANLQLTNLATFVELCPIPVLEFDESGAMLYQNDAAREQSGPGGPPAILPAHAETIIRECLANAAPVLGLDTERNGAHWRWWFFPNDDRDRTYAFGRERTHEVELAMQLTRAARMESVGRMAAGIAHDFNNVLTVIGGYSELLEDELKSDAGHAGDAHAIAAEVQRARGLIRQLLLLGRSQPPAPTEIDVNHHLRQIEPLVRHLVPRNVQLRFTLCEQPVPVRFDAYELEQAVMNLISNAGDAMPDGGIATVSTEIQPPARAVLRVTDTGTGIAPDDLPHVFEPFFTTKPAGKGTGLGLASVYGIVNRNGGRIDVETSEGRGSSFVVRLPLTAPLAHARAPGDIPWRAKSDLRGETIVDNEERAI